MLKEDTEFNPLFDSALYRSKTDWLIGMNASYYTIKFSQGAEIRRRSSSNSRTQNDSRSTQEHHDFKPETFYEIDMDITHENGRMGKWSMKKTRIKTEKADNIITSYKDTLQVLLQNLVKKKNEKNNLCYMT